MTTPQSTWFCSDISRQAGEPLIGTATRTDVWLMLEHDAAWQRKALEGSKLPQAVKDHLAQAEKTIPHARVELIKHEQHRAPRSLSFFVARTADTESSLYHFQLDAVEDVLSLDMKAVASGDPRFDARLVSAPMVIVCTNGLRDQCCARYGLPIYRAMAQIAGDSVWQCTHLGGHRLGPNVVVVPQGLSYGRVGVEDMAAILSPDHLHLKNFRGRTCYENPAQAAETFLRQHLGYTEVGGLSLASAAASGDKSWILRFNSNRSGGDSIVRVEKVAAGYSTYASCGDAEPSAIEEFHLIEIAPAEPDKG
jgi:hypothetical protein